MIDLFAARFERVFFFIFFDGFMVAPIERCKGYGGAKRGRRTFTQRAQRGLNRQDDHRVRPPTAR